MSHYGELGHGSAPNESNMCCGILGGRTLLGRLCSSRPCHRRQLRGRRPRKPKKGFNRVLLLIRAALLRLKLYVKFVRVFSFVCVWKARERERRENNIALRTI